MNQPSIPAETQPARSARPLTTALIVATAAFLQMLDSSIIGTAVPEMAASFRVGPIDVGLGIVVYVLAASIVIPAAAWIADRLGARRVFVASMLAFTAASVLCGISRGLPGFVAARALQGAAGALMGTIGQFILIRSVDRASLLRLMNLSSIPMLVAPVLGPPLGGFLTQSVGWPWIFYVNVPIGLVAAAIALAYLTPLPRTRRPFDAIGFLLNAATLSLLLFGLERVTGSRPGAEGYGAIVAGLVAGWLAIRHLRRHPHPIISLEPLRYATFRIAIAFSLPLVRLPIGALLFVVPIQTQIGFGMTALLSGIVLLAHAGGDLLMKPLMTRTFQRLGFRPVLVASTAITAIGIGLSGAFAADTPLALILLVMFVSGASRSFVMTGLNALAYDEVPEPRMPSAVTLNQITLQIAAALSVALATIMFEVSGALDHRTAGTVTVADCRNVLFAMGAIGLLAVPVLLRLRPDAGARLGGRSAVAPAVED